jgi:fused signal recognition particle receptor
LNWLDLVPALLPWVVALLGAGAAFTGSRAYLGAVRAARRAALPAAPPVAELERPPAGVPEVPLRPAPPQREAPPLEAPPLEAPPPPAPPRVAPPPPAPAPPPRADLRAGLRASRRALTGRLEALLRGRPALDPAALEEVETILFGADLGVRTAEDLLGAARTAGSPERVRGALEQRALEILSALPPAPLPPSGRPYVLLIVGVNGSGKTTSIGKLAAHWIGRGNRVLVAAGDTYRAAAIEQLEIWAQRVGAGIVKGPAGGDPAAVAFDAVKRARAEDVDVVLIDTAGRLQTDQNLMDQLTKVARVVRREIPEAPHETLLVLDANTGQNAIRQAQEFGRAVGVTGIVLTKLDGTAKGGVVLGIAQESGIPVRWVGIGEGAGDLQPFDAPAFVRALFARGDDGDD